MTTTTFIPKSSTQSVNWTDPTIWSTGVVPNDPAIDVVIPTTALVSNGQPYVSTITETGTFAAGSVLIANNTLNINGSLAVTGAFNLSTGANVSVGSSLSVGS